MGGCPATQLRVDVQSNPNPAATNPKNATCKNAPTGRISRHASPHWTARLENSQSCTSQLLNLCTPAVALFSFFPSPVGGFDRHVLRGLDCKPFNMSAVHSTVGVPGHCAQHGFAWRFFSGSVSNITNLLRCQTQRLTSRPPTTLKPTKLHA